jgi:hypothetical protein
VTDSLLNDSYKCSSKAAEPSDSNNWFEYHRSTEALLSEIVDYGPSVVCNDDYESSELRFRDPNHTSVRPVKLNGQLVDSVVKILIPL